MRDIFVLGLIFGSVPVIFFFPHVGILVWTWISYMNPHRLTYGSTYAFPVADVIGIATLVAWAISSEPKKFPKHPIATMILIYFGWTVLSTIFAANQTLAWAKLELFSKVLLLTFVGMALLQNKVRLHSVMWIIVVSCGYFAFKGGFFTITTGGNYTVFGPPNTFHGDNNGIAVTFLMLLPILRYMQMQAPNRLAWLAMAGAQLLTLTAILGTQSRGALVALMIMLSYMLLRSRQFMVLVLVVVAGFATFNLMPESWQERQLSTLDYEDDPSAQGRITMWRFAIDVANDSPIVGGGFDVFYDYSTRMKYLPVDEDGNRATGRASHSIYFETLGEHGYVGLLLFLGVGITGFFTAEKTRRRVRHRPDVKWAGDLAAMVQVSLVGFAAGGLFLQKATFDFYYQLLAIIMLADVIAARAIQSPQNTEQQAGDPILSFVFGRRKKQPYSPRPAE